MTLLLASEHQARIADEGRAAYPHECCGFLVGRFAGERAEVEEIRPAHNAREDSPRNRYLIPPEVFMRAQRQALAEGRDIVGFYHSHPDVAAAPSAFDRDHAWPGYHYVIVSVQQGEPGELRAWRLRAERDAFDETPVETPSPIREER